MKTDRELLGLAAKAAGVKGVYRSLEANFQGKFQEGISEHHAYKWWNPLTDDGDALRLAVKMGIDIAKSQIDYWDKHSNDPYAATRRAIVRAAAEIGASL